VKNKVGGAPYATTELELLYANGWNDRLDLVEYAEKLGVVTSGTWWVFAGEKYRKLDLTEEPVYGILRKSTLEAVEARRKANAEKAAKQRAEAQGDTDPGR
jgi:hypothetical protein